MRIPDPKANTTTEAYLAYKAGYLEESELKPKLYEPYLHFDAWLAYWAGLTNTYPLDKNGDPEMLTDEEALVAYLSGITDTYPEEIKDPYDVRIVGYLKHLASIRWPEPDYPVNNEEFYLSTMEPTHTSNSVPSSDIELDTAEGKIIDVEAYGDTTQTTYSGKNLFSGQWSQFDNQGGTGPTYGYFKLPTDGAYTLSLKAKNAITASNHFLGFNTDGGSVGGQATYKWVYQNLNATAGQVFTSENISYTGENRLGFVFIYPNNASTLQWLVENFEIQLESGSSRTTFEPYVGGIPAPNPDYPQPISVVTGENVVKVVGKNLLGLEDVAATVSPTGVTYSVVNGVVTINGTALSAGRIEIPLRSKIKLNDGVNYTFSLTESGTLTGGYYEAQLRTAQSTNLLSERNTRLPVTFSNIDGTVAYLGIYTGANRVFTNYTVSPQLELGSTATSYQAYTAQDYAISLTGKNLFNKATSTDGYRIDSNGDPYANASYFISDYIAVQPSTTYAYSRGAAGSSLSTIAYYKSDKTFISRTMPTIGSSDTSGTVTTPNNAYYARFCDINEVLDSTQLELGATATEYEAYSPIELAKIGTYQDRIYKDGEKWYVEKQVGKVTFTGAETIESIGSNQCYRFSVTNALVVSNVQALTPVESDYYTSATPADVYYGNVDYGVSLDNTSSKIRIHNKDCADKTALATWLGTHNTTVYYALATPTTTEITNSELISQLDALAGADTYNVKTYIKVTATEHNLPALLKVEAYKY